MKITVTGLTKKFGRVKALDNVSMSVEPGRIVAVLGANGAGKTTLLRIMAGIAGVSRGHIYYDGTRFLRKDTELRQRIMFLADFPIGYANMNALQHIGMVLKLYGKKAEGMEEQITAVLKDLDMLPLVKVPLMTLSRGQYYKVMLTALTAVSPELWLIDEPFASGMDPMGIQSFKRYARAAADAGSTILYTTQILEAAEGLCDEVVILDRGEIRFSACIDELHGMNKGDDPVLVQILNRLKEAQE